MADCFVICSEKENFPTTCLEAFCCGTPVAGFAAGGTAETVPAPYGRFCAYGDITALQSVVEQQLSVSFPRESVARAAERRYSQQTMYQNYRQVYEAILKEEDL